VKFILYVASNAKMLASQTGVELSQIDCVLFNENTSWRFTPGTVEQHANEKKK